MTNLASMLMLLSIGMPAQETSIPPAEAAPATDCESQLERERQAHAATREELKRMHENTAKLEAELARLEEERVVRETEWLVYTRAISGLSDSVIPASVDFKSDLEEEQQAVDQKRTAERIALESRSHEVFVALRSLFVAEGIEGYDFLEAGLVGDGYTGPIVLRMMDQLRRPVGSLSAARLRLEGSEAGHTLTLIFEEGYERRGGMKLPFKGGTLQDLSGAVRRIVLPSVDPGPWMEALPELFAKQAEPVELNDGKWNLRDVKTRLNELLREDVAAGHYRLRSVGGIRDNVFQTVHLVQWDVENRIVRRFFADQLRLEVLERGIQLTLESGAQIRGEEKLPFLDGRFRIYLPGVRMDAWCDGRLPGLRAEPAPAK